MGAPTSLVVPVRTVRAVDADAPVEIGEESVDRDFASRFLDPRDLQALALALELRAGRGGDAEVEAIGLADPAQAPLLRDVAARGADRVTAIWDERMRGGDPLLAAAALSPQIPDGAVVLTGSPALGGALAQRLGVPSIAGCLAARWSEGRLEIERTRCDGGTEVLEAGPAAVLVVAEAAEPAPLPEFAAARAAARLTIEPAAVPAELLAGVASPGPLALRWKEAERPRLITEDVEAGAAALAELLRAAAGAGS
ncbi:MAG: hypothetical protein JST31_03270 [Actinobacteria bacterium]|nr:hypothetical protein [Actinomycetota bacterium]